MFYMKIVFMDVTVHLNLVVERKYHWLKNFFWLYYYHTDFTEIMQNEAGQDIDIYIPRKW
jgi:hypothetical protein